jgi:hypothetical protein
MKVSKLDLRTADGVAACAVTQVRDALQTLI